MEAILRKLSLLSVVFAISSSAAIADELSFKDFTDLKEGAVKAGRMIGGLQACHEANQFSGFGSKVSEKIDNFRTILDATEISREDMLTLDDVMTSESNKVRNSLEWTRVVNDNFTYFAATDCKRSDVCCVVSTYAEDTKKMESRVNWSNNKSPENAIKLFKIWGQSPIK